VRRGSAIRPFATTGGRRSIAAILLAFTLFSALSMALSIRATARSGHRSPVLEIAARQRMLAERYLNELLLNRAGASADPATTALLLRQSAAVLLDGGAVPAVEGDDDETTLPAATGSKVRAQLRQEGRLVDDLVASGEAMLAGQPVSGVQLTAHEHIAAINPVTRVRVLVALTANVSLNASRTIAAQTEHNVIRLIALEIVLGAAGLLTSFLLAFALIAATRRRTAHFQSLVTSSTDLVLVLGEHGCRYASRSVTEAVGAPETDLHGRGFERFVHPDDLPLLNAARTNGEPGEIVLRIRNRDGQWRHLEAHITDLRRDRRIRGVVLNARDITERVELEQQLTKQAFTDGLTGLANRALFRDRLEQALARSARSGGSLAVLLVDLDQFKQVNDTLGHDAGDRMLEEVAARFETVSRSADTLARLGGDEFAMAIEGAGEAEAVAVAARMLELLAEPVRIAGRDLAVAASIGISIHRGGAAGSKELIRDADLAMYAAKEAGRGVYSVYREDMARDLGDLLGLEHELRRGMQRGEFSVHYQPTIRLDGGEINGVEALMRWHSPTRGQVPPAQFIPSAETSGLILQLGEFVLHQACAQTAVWRRQGLLPDGFVTWVNVSGRQLMAGGVGALVRAALAASGLPPGALGLEVTETSIVVAGPAGDRARRELVALHKAGVQIAIDDFGTGFSSLTQLRSFPVDVIKVDRSFVQGVEQNSKDAAIATNIVSLAHALGLVAVAEGIETDVQLASMRALGCDHAQGFLFARPLPAGEVGALLAAGRPSASAAA
jgi:diguanylate cyclase (GGDEF)-like protein/PAS domain S-box-containing protein